MESGEWVKEKLRLVVESNVGEAQWRMLVDGADAPPWWRSKRTLGGEAVCTLSNRSVHSQHIPSHALTYIRLSVSFWNPNSSTIIRPSHTIIRSSIMFDAISLVATSASDACRGTYGSFAASMLTKTTYISSTVRYCSLVGVSRYRIGGELRIVGRKAGLSELSTAWSRLRAVSRDLDGWTM